MPHRVLVIQPDARGRKVVVDALQTAGHDADAPVDAYVGLDFALTRNYDLVVVEDEMPLIDGRGVIEALRESNIRTPVVALSERPPDQTEGLVEAGAAEVVQKPFRVSHLLDCVTRALANSR